MSLRRLWIGQSASSVEKFYPTWPHLSLEEPVSEVLHCGNPVQPTLSQVVLPADGGGVRFPRFHAEASILVRVLHSCLCVLFRGLNLSNS